MLKTFDDLKSLRGTWENHWQEVSEYVIPRKSDVTVEFSRGQKRHRTQILFDTTAQQSCILLSGAMSSLLTNPQVPWFELGTGIREIDEDDDVREYLQKTRDRMLGVLNNSNFHTHTHELYGDLCSFGTSAMSIEEDDQFVVRFNSHHISNFLLTSNHKGVIDELYREFKWTVAQIVGEFGIDNVSKSIKRSFEKGMLREEFKVVHGVYPDDRGEGGSGKLPFISQWVVRVDAETVRMGGFSEFPFVTPRWSLATGEDYGRSPAITALPDIKMINKMEETMIKGAQKTVDPPLQAPDDGFVRSIRTNPGGISYYRSGTPDRLEPVFNDFRFEFGVAVTDRTRDRIKQAFFIDQLQLREGPQMTATEVLQRRDQSMVLLGPVLARMQSEFLRPLIDRVFNIMTRKRLLPQAPAILEGRDLEVNYSSLIARVQKSTELQNLQRAFESAAVVMQVDPQSIDIMDADATVKHIMKLTGVPQQLIRDEDQVGELREQRQAAQQQAEQQVQDQGDAENASKLAGAVKSISGAA
jgi:hypothetical protein